MYAYGMGWWVDMALCPNMVAYILAHGFDIVDFISGEYGDKQGFEDEDRIWHVSVQP